MTLPNYKKNFLKDLVYLAQTKPVHKTIIKGLFRFALEPLLEAQNQKAVVLIRMFDTSETEGVLKRLEFNQAEVYSFCDNLKGENLEREKIWGDTEFLVVLSPRYSAVLVWDYSTEEVKDTSCLYYLLNSRDVNNVIRTISANSLIDLNRYIIEFTPERRANELLNKAVHKFIDYANSFLEEASASKAENNLLEANEELLQKYGVCAEAMVESAQRHAELLENCGFSDIVVSLKASDPVTTVRAYRLASQIMPYPLHIGVTEAGMGETALLKSAIGIGSLLIDGIGDTVRVSMTGGVLQEVEAAKKILRAVGLRKDGADVVSCPTCGRTRVNLEEIVKKVRAALPEDTGNAMKIAVMGCAVNGPGEAREADIGIAFGSVNAVVFKKGEIIYSDKLPQVVDRFIADASEMMKRK